MARKNTVIIGAGPRMFGEFLVSMLRTREDIDVIDNVLDGVDVIASATRHCPDLLILDLFLTRLSGISVINSVRSKLPEMKILILTDYESEQHVFEAFQAGAHGYCIKNSSKDELLQAIEILMAGKSYISPAVAAGVLEGYLNKGKKISKGKEWYLISKREREVLKLLAEAHKNKEIAEILCISCKTVEKHRSNIMSKLDLHNVAALTRYAIDQGLVNNGKTKIRGYIPSSFDVQTRMSAGS